MELRSKSPSGPLEKKWDKHRFEMKLVNPANKRKNTLIVVGSGLAGGASAAVSPGGLVNPAGVNPAFCSAFPEINLNQIRNPAFDRV